MREIIESDWKILRQLHPVAVERFCQRVLQEIEFINSNNANSFHQRYSDVFNVIKLRDKEMARIFDDLSRSTALIYLAAIKSSGLITEDEFLRFSADTRTIIDLFING